MFNQLTSTDVVTAIGATVRAAAREADRSDEFSRDQLMSAYSATRHLAAELGGYQPELARFADALVGRLRFAADQATSLAGVLEATAARIADSGDVATIGDALAELLALLRADDTADADAVATEVRAALRDLADREVEILADALG